MTPPAFEPLTDEAAAGRCLEFITLIKLGNTSRGVVEWTCGMRVENNEKTLVVKFYGKGPFGKS